MTYPAYPGQGQPQQAAQAPQRQATIIGEWKAVDHGIAFGKSLEFVIERVATQNGGSFETFQIYKPSVSKKTGQIQKWSSFPFPNGAREVVDMINRMLAQYAPHMGQFVWQPPVGQQPVNPGFQQYPNYPQGQAPTGMPAVPGPAYQPQQQAAGYPPQQQVVQPQPVAAAPQGAYPPYPGYVQR